MTTIIEQLVVDLGNELTKREWKLVTAESCTAGGLAYWITSVPGSSGWFERGFVTYSNIAKEELLGVVPMTLTVFGSVSEQTAREMAEGALRQAQAQVSIAITGIAGPGGGSIDKPVGTVWISCASINYPTLSSVDIFSGGRLEIREQAMTMALAKVIEYIQGN